MNILVDIDGTVCEDIDNEDAHLFPNAKLIEKAVEKVNKFYNEGHTITFFTSRTHEHRKVTDEYLKKCGFKYHYLLTDKPRGGRNGKYVWIDNLDVIGIKFNGNWDEITLPTPSKIGGESLDGVGLLSEVI